MKSRYSIRARLLLGAAVVLIAFVVGVGLAVQRAHANSVRAAHYSRLQATVYLLLARAELDDSGELVMPPTLAEPRLAVPQSGLYASIYNAARQEAWRSASSVGVELPYLREGVRIGQWRSESVTAGGRSFHSVRYAVNWAADGREAPLVLSVLEDSAAFNREVAVFARTMWTWLGGAAVLLMLAQLLLLRWALAPLRRVAVEVGRIERGEQARIEGHYPDEIIPLTGNLNTLIQQERVRQSRYKEALSFLAHSLKTPLAVLRNALAEPAGLPETVEQQVKRMDDIVQHQLGRAAAGGAARFVSPVLVAPVLERVAGALGKVYAERQLAISVACPPDLAWRIDEGDLFEIAGNVMDNAAKWARQQVKVSAALTDQDLLLRVEDDGPGFSDTETVLQMHVRLDERVPGHGVGLTVVNDLVMSHHGQLTLTRGELGGARVEIRLPAP